LWYLVGSVSCRAHVEDVGNTFVELNVSAGGKPNPKGGTDSDPVKKARIVFKGTRPVPV